MAAISAFRKELEAAILEKHCAHHPMVEKWARGELGRKAMMGWAVEHYHWTHDFMAANFLICANAPRDVVELELENFNEEADPERPHVEIVLKFAKANGANINKVRKGQGLPTTRSPMLYSRVLPALRQIYKFDEDSIEHFWLHVEADTEHGDAGFEVLDRHCKTRAQKDMAIHWARESAKMRWFYFDGIYLHYEMGYSLA